MAVETPGAFLYFGDCKAAMGNGEITAAETKRAQQERELQELGALIDKTAQTLEARKSDLEQLNGLAAQVELKTFAPRHRPKSI